MSDPTWSRSISILANQDIYDVLLYTREAWGLNQVDAYEVLLIEGLERIRSYPKVGSPVPSLGPDVRTWRVRQHVVFYAVDEEERQVTVLRVLHERQHVTQAMLTEVDEN